MAQDKKTAGIHHVTAFAGDPQANVDFYSGVLGLRLVKKTVNFDAPDVYHLYFGDEAGKPGTAMTFFPYEGARRGRVGGGQVGYTTFVVPPGALPFWEDRLRKFAIPFERSERFGETFLRFADQDGLPLELVERQEGPDSTWSFGGVPADKAIKGFGGALLYSLAPQRTVAVLQHVLGLERVEGPMAGGDGVSRNGPVDMSGLDGSGPIDGNGTVNTDTARNGTGGQEVGFIRLRAAGDIGQIIDVKVEPVARGVGGAGTVHHIAWRAVDKADQEEWRDRVSEAGFDVTPIVDRNYFTSIYFREEGGILFEIATDEPGFAVDEPLDALGEQLKLPEWYEPHRERITAGLKPIQVRVLEEDFV